MRRHIERYTPHILAAALLAMLAGCRPALNPFTAGDYIGGTATAAATVETALSDAELDEYRDGLAKPENGTPLTIGTVTNALAPMTGQTISITFTNGVVDEDTIAAGILLYPLATAADTDGAHARGTALAMSVRDITPDGTGGCRVRLSADLSGTTVSERMEILVKADTLTANGGTNRLNLDGDGVYGEASEDEAVSYITVSGAPVDQDPLGSDRDPQASLGITAYTAILVGEETHAFDISNSLGGNDFLTTASVGTDRWVWSKFDPTDGTWSAASPTPSYAGGTLTWTFLSDFARGDLYRLRGDTYEVKESESVRGYTHRWGYNSLDPDERYYFWYLGAVRGDAVLANATAHGGRAEGTTDLSGGFDWATTNQTFDIATDGGDADTVTLNTTTGNLTAVVNEVNNELATAGIDGQYTASVADFNLDGTNESITITRDGTTGVGSYFTLTAGAADALATLGIAGGTYVGRDAWTGDVAGVKRSAVSTSDYARWIEVNFSAPVDTYTITPTSVVILDADNEPAEWEASGLLVLTETIVRISLPSTFRGNGTYRVRVYPTVLDLDGIAFADTSSLGTRSALNDRADLPYFESSTWNWN